MDLQERVNENHDLIYTSNTLPLSPELITRSKDLGRQFKLDL